MTVDVDSQPPPDQVDSPKENGILPDGAIRIAVKCQSHQIPGERGEREKTMGNLICQRHWHRDMDSSADRMTRLGYATGDGEKVYFLLDTGKSAPDQKEEDIPIRMYRWNGKKWYVIIPRRRISWGKLTQSRHRRERSGNMKLQECIRTNFPFNRKETVQPRRRGKTVAEFRAEMDDDMFDDFMNELVSQRMRAMDHLSPTEREWSANHRREFGGIMQFLISRMKYKKLPLLEYQKTWDAEHTDGLEAASLALVEKVLEIYISETPTLEKREALGLC